MNKRDKAMNKTIASCLQIIKEAAKENGKNKREQYNFYKNALVNLAGNGTFAIIKEDNGIAPFITDSLAFMQNIREWFQDAIKDVEESLDEEDEDENEDEDEDEHSCEHCK